MLRVGAHQVRSLLVLVAALMAFAPAAHAFDPATEAENFGKGNERAAIYSTPEYQALLRQVSVQNRAAAMAMQAADPERNYLAQLCATGEDGCAGDVRLYDWEAKGYGLVKPVVFSDFMDAVKVLGQFWAVINEPPPPA